VECPWRQETDVISSVMSDKQETQQLVVDMLDKVFVFSEQLFSFLIFSARFFKVSVNPIPVYKDEVSRVCLSSSTEVYTRDDVN